MIQNGEDRGAALLPARVHDQNVQTAETADRVIDETPAKGFVADVTGNGEAFSASLLDQGDHLAGVRLLLGKMVDRDVRAFAGEGDRGRASHPGIAPCHQRLAT